MSNLGRKLLDKPFALWAVLFVLAPLCMVVYYAFTDTGGAFSLHSVSQIPSYLSTILLSVLYGLAATVICLLLGYPFAYLISKHAARRQRTVVLLVMLPMWMNFLIRTYSWMTILGDSGVINSFLTAVGLEPAKLINTGGAVILGMVYNFLPYMILPIYSVLEKIDGKDIVVEQKQRKCPLCHMEYQDYNELLNRISVVSEQNIELERIDKQIQKNKERQRKINRQLELLIEEAKNQIFAIRRTYEDKYINERKKVNRLQIKTKM